jgi:processive 1,2-diacylglycerol beta-glucosyltransferase
MITLYDTESGAAVGRVTEAQLRFLTDQLEEEWAGDTDYYFTADTLELLEQKGADSTLLNTLRTALGTRDGIEIRWAHES